MPNKHIFSTPMTHLWFLSLLILLTTACSDNETSEVKLTHPVTPAISTTTNNSNEINVVVETINDDTVELAIPPKPLSQTTLQTSPFKILALKAQLEQKFGRNVIDSQLFLPEGFYPLGWSKDGNKIAYASQRLISGASDKPTFDVFIQDLITDKIIWKSSSKKSNNKANNINYGGLNKEKILAELEKNKIQTSTDFSLQHSPIILKKDTVSYKVKVATSKKHSSLKGYEVLLKSSQKGIKKVANEQFKKRHSDEVGSKSQVHILGYLQGANPSRIALLIGVLELGWEGTKTVRYKVIGASLTAGKWH